MKVVLIRHFKVNHQWRRYCTYKEFSEELAAYDVRSVIQPRELDFPAEQVYISTLLRTKETAGYLKGDKKIIKTALIDEVNLQGQSRSKRRLSSALWYSIAYLKWMFNSKAQVETHNATKERAREFLTMIKAKNEDCIVVSHGMFLLILIKMMRKEGFSGPRKKKVFYNGEAVEYIKNN
jgi:broad specificity phosphatase PhoE